LQKKIDPGLLSFVESEVLRVLLQLRSADFWIVSRSMR